MLLLLVVRIAVYAVGSIGVVAVGAVETNGVKLKKDSSETCGETGKG